jgi:hypothetical protein
MIPLWNIIKFKNLENNLFLVSCPECGDKVSPLHVHNITQNDWCGKLIPDFNETSCKKDVWHKLFICQLSYMIADI